MADKTENEVKPNVKWLRNGLNAGYGYNAGELGYVDPKLTTTYVKEDKGNIVKDADGKPLKETMNTIKYLVKFDFVEEI